VRNCEFTSQTFTVGLGGPFRDAFYLDDAIYQVLARSDSPPHLHLRLFQAERNDEVHLDDRTLTNIIARPEIAVSRLNAHHVAVNPDPTIVGDDGRFLLDARGNPQAIAASRHKTGMPSGKKSRDCPKVGKKPFQYL
jgi:hypothetical protein